MILAGGNFGGAIPDTKVGNSTGSGGIGFIVGAGIDFKAGDRFYISPSLSYVARRFSYESHQTKDTVVEIEFQGSTAHIPTYYTANVFGNVFTHNIDLSVNVNYLIRERFLLNAGASGKYAFAGNDNTHIVVTIGEGGIIDDIITDQNNWNKINRFDVGFDLGASFLLSDDFTLLVSGERSLTRFYNAGYMKTESGGPVSFYYTAMIIKLIYSVNLHNPKFPASSI